MYYKEYWYGKFVGGDKICRDAISMGRAKSATIYFMSIHGHSSLVLPSMACFIDIKHGRHHKMTAQLAGFRDVKRQRRRDRLKSPMAGNASVEITLEFDSAAGDAAPPAENETGIKVYTNGTYYIEIHWYHANRW